ncbi:hypothetical protein [Brevibacterium sp. Mu109]|uniref:hypothetical protein n=1 Tax=Brevibacterium sp. Mu109 TaxID=1255669 RepID=UPI000C78D82A|nr:hypothetical protein [Brevibacterium sp. Mu109]
MLQQVQRVVQVVASRGVLVVVGIDPVLDRLQPAADAVLFLLQQVQRDRSGVVCLKQFALLLLQPSPFLRQVRQRVRLRSHERVELGMQMCPHGVPSLSTDLHLLVVPLDQPLDLFDEHRLPGAVTAPGVTVGAVKSRVVV